MNKFFKILFVLLPLPYLFIGTWIGVNLWPRTIEAPLWTEADLAVPEDKTPNGYDILLSLMDNPLLTSEALEIPEILIPLQIFEVSETPADAELFWTEAKKLETDLNAFIREKMPILEEYQKILKASRFVDKDSLSLGNRIDLIKLLDFQKIGALYMIDRILQKDMDQAYSIWTRTFLLDQSWLNSARSALSHAVAVGAVRQDLTLLHLMKNFLPAHTSEQAFQLLQNFDAEKIGYRRALIWEYLFVLTWAETIIPKKPQDQYLWSRI
ncbi:MAG TPA: hypothetical protein DF383_08235, partial [Deltaproteobacteria bacterium]|nr:hypothetical protein [Deltaproteobacteria bacterium]